MHCILRVCAIAPLLAVAIGCGAAGPVLPDPAPVTGKVFLDKEPLANAMVFFVPTGEKMGNGAAGVTKEDGSFELSTNIGDTTKKGAIPGSYKVWVSRLVLPDGKPVVPEPNTPPANLGAMESLPPRFSDANSSELTATVTDKGGDFPFTVSLR